MNAELLNQMDTEELLAIAEAFGIEDADKMERDSLCARIARNINSHE
jgi:hypothetical protein